MKDKPRIFLPGTPEFTQDFLFRGIKFPASLVSDLIRSSCLGRNAQPPERQSRRFQAGKRREHRPRPCRITGSRDGGDLLGHQIQPFMRGRHSCLQSGLQKVFFEVCLPLQPSPPHCQRNSWMNRGQIYRKSVARLSQFNARCHLTFFNTCTVLAQTPFWLSCAGTGCGPS